MGDEREVRARRSSRRATSGVKDRDTRGAGGVRVFSRVRPRRRAVYDDVGLSEARLQVHVQCQRRKSDHASAGLVREVESAAPGQLLVCVGAWHRDVHCGRTNPREWSGDSDWVKIRAQGLHRHKPDPIISVRKGAGFMPSDAGLQDSVDKSREALRRSIADGLEDGPAQHWAAEARPHSAPHERLALLDLHPFFRGLLETLPEPGMDWPPANREQWLETARNIFALLYQDPADVREPIPLRPHQPATMYPSERHIA